MCFVFCSKVLEDCGLANDLLVQLTDDMVEYSLYYVCESSRFPLLFTACRSVIAASICDRLLMCSSTTWTDKCNVHVELF